ncbi:MAG: DUF4062 domain-containing protein, partial [Planctomycetes bacterium]|nr:DUF4062 domain-containing protein [Planctomycetota bacterium]
MVEPWQSLKVFVSSTFKDLEKERDKLHAAFEGVKERIAERRLSLIPYDLRWRDRKPGEPVVDWCLEAVRECQYFVNILDGRYGWRPPDAGAGAANERKISITEMEIDEAVRRGARRLFFFRDPSRVTPPEAVGETQTDREALEALKHRLAGEGELVFTWNETADLAEGIGRAPGDLIDDDYPPGKVVSRGLPTLAESTRELIEEKVRGFVGRGEHLARLAEFARSRGAQHTLAVHAVAGTGKSALLARFVKDWNDPAVPVVTHFLGAGGESREPAGITRAVAESLRQIRILAEDPDPDPEVRRRQVSTALAGTERPLVLALDGIDEVSDAGRDLLWLPFAYGPNVRVILTTRPVDVFETASHRPGVATHELPPLSQSEMERIVAAYGGERRLEIAPADRQELVSRAAGNPLFLKVALDEIALSGVAVGQLATTVDGLFRQIVGRLGAEYGDDRIADYLGLIAAGREGLAVDELAESLSDKAALPSGELHGITRALANFVVTRRRLLAFFHPEFERTVKERLGVGPMRGYHRRLLKFFTTKGAKRERRLVELAYQATKAEWWQNVLNILTHLPYLEAKAKAGLVFDLAADYDFALARAPVTLPPRASLERSPGVVVTRRILELLAEALGRDLVFLSRHPESLFQQLYNYCYWYDCPEGRAHYVPPEGGWKTPPPWEEPGPKLYMVAEAWRERTQARKSIWLGSRLAPAVELGTALRLVLRGHESGVTSAAFSADGSRVVSASDDSTVRIWDAATGAELRVLRGHENLVNSAAFSPHGSRVVSTSSDKTVRMWDAATGAELRVLRGHEKEVRSATFGPDGSRVVSASWDKTVRIWDAATGAELRVLRRHEEGVKSAAFSPDGSRVVLASDDETVRIWDAATGAELRVLRGHEHRVTSAAFSPDGSRVLSASDDETVRIWDAATGAELRVLPGHENWVKSAAFSPDGARVVSASWDKTVRIWDAATGAELRVLPGQQNPVMRAAFSPDGSRVVSASEDKTVRIWDAATGAELRVLRGHNYWVNSAAFSPDGSRVVSASVD